MISVFAASSPVLSVMAEPPIFRITGFASFNFVAPLHMIFWHSLKSITENSSNAYSWLRENRSACRKCFKNLLYIHCLKVNLMESAVDILSNFEANVKWLRENYEPLKKDFNNEWVAVLNKSLLTMILI
jgi:hypothetical protein